MSQSVDSTTKLEAAATSEDVALLWRREQAAPGEPIGIELIRQIANGRGDGLEWIRLALVSLQDLTGAERIFFFDVSGPTASSTDARAGAHGDVGQCLLALDFDREAVAKPEGKTPTGLLRRVLESKEPLFAFDSIDGVTRTEGDAGDARARGYGAAPLVVRGVCHGVVYFDHRFQPLQVSVASAHQVVGVLHATAVRYALEKLTSENRSLWVDLLEHRERWKTAESLNSHASVQGSRSKPSPRRRDLKGDYDSIIGSSSPMIEMFQLLDRIRSSSAPVLINGESGTGKELIANAVHANSPRRDKEFVSENCGALTETLLESELFGYVKGAFTGANRDHKGLFELADGGTLFLDEVGDMSPAMQKKLLRAIQEGVIRRVGGKDYIKVDVRIISATNKDLLQEVRLGHFREDLYYRLNVINLKLPPLRERREDIPELVQFFLGQLKKESGLEKTVATSALQLLMKHSWPGNIRELQNEVKRLFALSDAQIEVSQLSDAIRRGEGLDLLSSNLEDELRCMTLREALERVEKALIKRSLLAAQGNKSQVAKQLQIPKTSLYNKISKYNLDQEVQDALY